jgi:hypothetical protein
MARPFLPNARPGLSGLKIVPLLRNLHQDPRWKQFLQKMKLPLN